MKESDFVDRLSAAAIVEEPDAPFEVRVDAVGRLASELLKALEPHIEGRIKGLRVSVQVVTL